MLGHGLFVKPFDEGKVLLSQHFRLVEVVLLLRLEPFLRFCLLLGQLGDNARELQDLVVNCVHLILVFEQVVFVHVFDLELVVLGATSLDAVAVIEDVEGVLAFFVAARTHRLHIVVAEDVVASCKHVGELELIRVDHVSSRVIPLGDQGAQVHDLLFSRRVHQVQDQVVELALRKHPFDVEGEQIDEVLAVGTIL